LPFTAGTGGRPKGAKNRSTRDLRAVLDALARGPKHTDLHAQRLHQLTLSSDEHVAVKALNTVLAYRYGKPKESVELTGAEGGPVVVKFVVA
jgi:hypothetical protein